MVDKIMEEKQFGKIQDWFESLNKKIDNLVTKEQFENRYQALFTAMSNLHSRVLDYKGQQDQEILIIKRAIHDLEIEFKKLQESRL